MRFISVAAIAALLAAPAFADDTKSGSMSGQTTNGNSMATGGAPMMGSMHHGKNASMHMMPATITAVDLKTGLVEVNSAGMDLKLHFPPASVSGLKSGDKITIHMGFTKS